VLQEFGIDGVPALRNPEHADKIGKIRAAVDMLAGVAA
jgi:hypothetical protein